jgi:hypothetical protein
MPTQDFKGTVNGYVANQILGDGVTGRTLRYVTVRIANGTDATTLNCSTSSQWNGDTNAAADNIGWGGTVDVWTLSATGEVLTLLNTGLTDSCVVALSCNIYRNLCGTVITVTCDKTASGIDFNFHNAATSASLVMTTLVDTGEIQLRLVYITA